LVDADFISRMKAGAWLINTARGDLVEEGALVQALQSGQLRGAALDVFLEEPPDQDNPLLKLDNVITTPHMGAHADSATNNMGRISLAECLRVLSGQDPQYRVV
jgi:phosphoglycerate dehydrogenase-like enzyme